jgi:hypothetical protein
MEKEMTKTCRVCGEEKSLTPEYFHRHKSRKDGFLNLCKICRSKTRTDKYNTLTEEQKNAVKKRATKWNKKNVTKRRKIVAKSRRNNRQYYCDYNKNRNQTDILFRLQGQIRSLMCTRIKNKSMKTSDIIGCDWNTFKNHIESKFTEGMTWDNYGYYGWHYDHIIPISSAESEEDVIRLNHYTNFQPLWWDDNLQKSNKISEEWGNVDLTV